MPGSFCSSFSSRSATSSDRSASVEPLRLRAGIVAAVARIDDDARHAEPELPGEREAAGAVRVRRCRRGAGAAARTGVVGAIAGHRRPATARSHGDRRGGEPQRGAGGGSALRAVRRAAADRAPCDARRRRSQSITSRNGL